MNTNLLPLLLVMPPVAVAPVADVGFVLQLAGLGSAVGSLVAVRARRRDPDADTSRITMAWSSLGLVLGVLIAAVWRIAALVG